MGLLDFIIHIGVDAAHAHKGFDTLGAKAGAVSSHIGSKLAATFSVAAVAGFIEHTAMAALETEKLAESLGTTSEMIMKIQKLATIKHLDPEKFFGALGRAEKFMGDAMDPDSKGAEKKREILQSIGLSLADISGKGADATKVLMAFGRALNGEEATLEQRQTARAIFGRGGARIANALGDLAGIVPTFNKEQFETLSKGAEAWEKIERSVMKVMKVGVANALINVVKDYNKFAGMFHPVWRGEDISPTDGGESGVFDMKTGKFTPREGLSPTDSESGGGIFDMKTGKFTAFGEKDKTRGAGTGMQALARFGRESDSLASVGTLASKPIAPKTEVFQDKSLTLQERTARALDEINDKMDDGADF
jgi:hypothetical protein